MGFGVGSRQGEGNVERKRKIGGDGVTLCERRVTSLMSAASGSSDYFVSKSREAIAERTDGRK